MDKLISVVIPTFNRNEMTVNAIQSVVSSFKDLLEIVVVDDCGTTPFAFQAEANASGIQVVVLRLHENVGPGMARQAGVEKARGQYIAFLDSDDCYDKGWMDYVASELLTNPGLHNHRVIISGVTDGSGLVGRLARNVLSAIPKSYILTATRHVGVLFNFLYTPSIVLHRELCAFKNGLRYCEDYYSTMRALMRAEIISLPNVVACRLGRKPNSAGGESASRNKMYKGEMQVRHAMLSHPDVPSYYKLLVPFGMLYQVTRTSLKWFVRLVRIRI